MTPTPPSTTSSSAGQSPEGQFRVVRKRNRIPLSCAPCRHRKLKCNRAHPCDNCSKRGDTESCTYASPGTRKKNSTSNTSSGSPDEMQNRIDRLESLVLSLMTNGPQSAGPAAATAAISAAGPVTGSSVSGSSAGFPLDVDGDDVIKEEIGGQQQEDNEIDQVARSIGVMKVDNNKAVFMSEAHWYSILAEISEVKNWFADHKKQYEENLRRIKASYPDDERTGTSFLFITEKPSSKEEILRQFPPKNTCDTLIARFFNTYNYDPAFHIIHGPTFQKQYDQHWMNPSETPVIWLGMAIAMMVIALQSFQRTGEEPPEYQGRVWQMLKDYRRLTAQSLALADPMQPISYMLETLILYTLGEFGRSRDAETVVLVGVSVIVRLASRMGYHRDSKYYSAITPFQGEMRRRIWTVVRQCDLLFSSQAGLAPMIRCDEFNTDLPRNLYDDELYEDMKALPPSRPITEPTPMCYVIYKAQLIHVFGQIVEDMQSLRTTPYEQVMKLDAKLRETQSNIPPLFKMRGIEESLRDPSSLVMQRYILDLLYLRAQCILHRKYMGHARDNNRYSYSRRTAIEAAMEMLRHQVTLHNESRQGGRLSNIKWYISSLTSSDFLLAAMMVCLDLHTTAEAERAGRRPLPDAFDAFAGPDPRAQMMAALDRSLAIWDPLRDQSMEAFKAHGILNAMLTKLRPGVAGSGAAGSAPAAPTTASAFAAGGRAAVGFAGLNGAPAADDDANVAPEHSAAMTLGMLSTGALTPNSANMFAAYDAAGAAPPAPGLPAAFMASPAEQNGGPAASAASPFSGLFGAPGLAFQDLGMQNANGIDWVSGSFAFRADGAPAFRGSLKRVLTASAAGCLGLVHPGPVARPRHLESVVRQHDGHAQHPHGRQRQPRQRAAARQRAADQ